MTTNILGIETSCDETAAAVVSFGDIRHDRSIPYSVLGNALYSQASKHAEYGGIYPNLAKREHQANIVPMIQIALEKAGLLSLQKISSSKLTNKQLDQIKNICDKNPEMKDSILSLCQYPRPSIGHIAVTRGPGLAPALWVGVNTARALACAWDIPLIGVNHMIGHIVAGFAGSDHLPAIEEPLLALLVSGGHTELVMYRDSMFKKIGQTQDDALGESFDKVARMLDLSYPGGPEISRYAECSRQRGLTGLPPFPRPMIHADTLNFSYSGLKTAVRRKIEGYKTLSKTMREDIAREFEDAAIEAVLVKTVKAIETHHPKTFVIGGGVAANMLLRKKIRELRDKYHDISFYIPDPALTTDNAVMIALAGWFNKDDIIDSLFLRADAKESL